MNSSSLIKDKKQMLISIFSGTLVAVASTLMMILLFAVLIRFFNISDGWIFPVNQVIKVVSIFLGSLLIFKKSREKGFLKGLLLGFVYYLLSTIVFSVLQGSFSFKLSNLYDLMLTIFIAGIVGIIVVNIKSK